MSATVNRTAAVERQLSRPATHSIRTSRATTLSLAAIGLFLAVQVALILTSLRGAFLDEAIYITAGLRTLQGHAGADGYYAWIPGSQLWPVLGALGFKLGALAGARIIAASLVSMALLAATQACRNLFGARAALWAALFAVTSGPVLAIAHLAVYDVVALLGISGAVWSVTELARRDHRGWLVAASAFLVLGALGKYPALIFSVAPLAALLVALRGERSRLDLALFGFLTTGLLLIYFLEDREKLSMFLLARVNENPTFGVTRKRIGFAQAYFLAIPALLALAGLARARNRGVGRALFVALLLPPIYHMWAGTSVGEEKHVVFGLVVALPLIGLALDRASRTAPRTALATLGLIGLGWFGVLQMSRIDRGFPDPTNSAAALVERAHPGERFLINIGWPYTLALYQAGLIRSPYQVYDAFRVAHGQATGPLCSYSWFVDAPGGSAWPQQVLDAVHRCGTFHPVYQSRLPITGLGSDLRFVNYTGPLTIWENTRPGRAGS